jgi:hypothetical protein
MLASFFSLILSFSLDRSPKLLEEDATTAVA